MDAILVRVLTVGFALSMWLCPSLPGQEDAAKLQQKQLVINAIRDGDLALVKKLARNPNVDITDSRYVEIAVYSNRPDAMTYLLGVGGKVKMYPTGVSPFTDTCGNKRADVLQALIDGLRKRGGGKLEPVYVAMLNRTTPAWGATPLMQLYEEQPLGGRKDVVFRMTKLLVENGADLNIPDKAGRTPTKLMNHFDHDGEIAQYLRSHGGQ
jgi:hypothetical protein